MNIERFLREYPTLGEEIMRLNKELNNLIACKEDTYNTMKAQVMSDMPKISASGENPSLVEKAVVSLIDNYGHKIEYYTLMINNLMDQQQIFEKVWFMPDLLCRLEKTIIEMRYFKEFHWDLICRQTCYSRPQCMRIAKQAVKTLQNEMDNIFESA